MFPHYFGFRLTDPTTLIRHRMATNVPLALLGPQLYSGSPSTITDYIVLRFSCMTRCFVRVSNQINAGYCFLSALH